LYKAKRAYKQQFSHIEIFIYLSRLTRMRCCNSWDRTLNL